jgi:hypothetical protein
MGFELARYLERDVLIYDGTWTEGTNVYVDINPWTLFFQNSAISKKLENYAYVRCNLELEMVINGSPFYYGGLLLAYNPLAVYDAGRIPTISVENCVPLSQRPHVWCYAGDNQGGTICAPFFHQQNWIKTSFISHFNEMGSLTIMSPDVLLNANSVAGQDVGYKLYARAKDLEVSGPTEHLILQSGDEEQFFVDLSSKDFITLESRYGKEQDNAKPSNIASNISKGLNEFSKIPVIGEFAKVGSTIADVASDVLGFFGFSNIPNIENVSMFQNSCAPQHATTEISVPMEKLTLDPKNELTVDPRIAGLDGEDELAIKNLVTRESFLAVVRWASTAVTDTPLFSAPVDPFLVRVNGALIYGSPVSHFSQLFQYWRGDIIFKFKFVCSKYHRGRVRIKWDPFNLGVASGTTECINKIIDIEESPEIEFRVPFAAFRSWLRTLNPTSERYSYNAFYSSFDDEYSNGTLSLIVLNPQTSPVATADIQVYISYRAADNFELAAPKELPQTLSYYSLQSDEKELDQELISEISSLYDLSYEDNITYQAMVTDSMIMNDSSSEDPELYSIYMGESIQSLRCILRRFQYIQTLLNGTDPEPASEWNTLTFRTNRYPLYNGYDPNGIHTTGTAVSYNYVKNTPFNWIGSCFVASRGSVNWRMLPNNYSALTKAYLSRYTSTITVADYAGAVNSYLAGASRSAKCFIQQATNNTGYEGATITNQITQAGLTASVPFYSPYRLRINDPVTRTLGESVDVSYNDNIEISIDLHRAKNQTPSETYVNTYFAIGADFNFIFFENVPVMYNLAVPAT